MNRKALVVLSFVGVFAAGGVFGGFLALRWAQKHPSPRETRHHERDRRFTEFILHRYTERLELTEAQVAELRPIVQDAAQELHEIRSSGYLNTLEAMKQMNGRVRGILTEQQKIQLEALLAEFREHWNSQGKPRKRPPPPRED